MIRIDAVPYKRASASHIRPEPWQLITGDSCDPLPEILPKWDYNTNLTIRRTVAIELKAIQQECGLNADDLLSTAVVWRSQNTALRGLVCTAVVPPGTDARAIHIEGCILGRELSRKVAITTSLFVTAQRPSTQPLSPTRAGSILWQDTATVLVEGTAARFPIDVVDFSKLLGVPSGAAWYLSWNSLDLHLPFLGSVRLLINANCEAVVRSLSDPMPDKEAIAIRSMIYYDVGRILIRGALLDEDFVRNRQTFADGTVGGALARLFSLLFEGDSRTGVRDEMVDAPERFDSELQAKLRLLRS